MSLREKEKAKPQEAAGCAELNFYCLNTYLNQPCGIKQQVSIHLLPLKHSSGNLEDTWVSRPHCNSYGVGC